MMATPPKFLGRVRDKIRLKHCSIRTEETYVQWVRRLILHHDKRHPAEMGALAGMVLGAAYFLSLYRRAFLGPTTQAAVLQAEDAARGGSSGSAAARNGPIIRNHDPHCRRHPDRRG